MDGLRDTAVINLSNAATMVVDDSSFSLQLTTACLLGFGIRTRHAITRPGDAMEILAETPIDLLVVDCDMPDMDGYELVRWLRRTKNQPNAFVPVIMTAAHVRRSRVQDARDCGANFMITKPFSARNLLERIVWVARDERPFLEVGDYFGPDRRFRDEPPGVERRSDRLRLAQLEAERAAKAAQA